MKPNDAFDEQVRATWAAYFVCPVSDLTTEGTTLLPRERMQGKGVVHIARIDRRALTEIDPDLAPELRRILAEGGERAVLSGQLLRESLGEQRVASVDGGLIFHLRPGDLVRPPADDRLILRPLSAADEAALAALKAACTPEDADEAYVEVDHELAWGCFDGELLAAVGTTYRRNGFMDFGVLTHPAYRGRGLAARIVCTLSDETVKLGLIPQYRCDVRNQSSRHVAERTGFTLYFTTELVMVRPE